MQVLCGWVFLVGVTRGGLRRSESSRIRTYLTLGAIYLLYSYSGNRGRSKVSQGKGRYVRDTGKSKDKGSISTCLCYSSRIGIPRTNRCASQLGTLRSESVTFFASSLSSFWRFKCARFSYPGSYQVRTDRIMDGKKRISDEIMVWGNAPNKRQLRWDVRRKFRPKPQTIRPHMLAYAYSEFIDAVSGKRMSLFAPIYNASRSFNYKWIIWMGAFRHLHSRLYARDLYFYNCTSRDPQRYSSKK